MAGEWRNTSLGEFVTLQRGHDLTDSERQSGEVPVVGAAGQNGFHDTAIARGPGVVVGRSGASFGQVHYCETDFWPHNTGLYVTDFRGNNPRFAFYFLKAIDFNRYNSGSAQPSLNRNFIYPIEVKIPPPDEQRAIAHILGTLDDKIDLNRRMNVTLEAMARALFKSWFVNFDPVRAKAEGHDPGLPKAIAELFPDRLVDSEFGEIPEGWTVSRLRDLTEYLSRGIGPSYVEEGGVGVLNQKCIRDRRVNYEFARRHDPSKRSIEGRTLQRLDILINSTGVGTLGRVAQLLTVPETTIVDSHVSILRASADTDPYFLGVALSGRETDIEALGEGSTGQTELSRERLGSLECLSPPPNLQTAFGRVAGALLSRLSKNEDASHTRASLRDVLLPKLISGELRVKDAGRSIGVAL
jgi:type I restriction enzyme S subunit